MDIQNPPTPTPKHDISLLPILLVGDGPSDSNAYKEVIAFMFLKYVAEDNKSTPVSV